MQNNSSSLVHAITQDGSARILCAITTEIVERAHEIHSTSKTMTAALGRALTAASLLGALLKNEKDSLTLQIKGDGPAGTVVCVSDFKGNVRGYAENPFAELPPNSVGKLDVGGAIGKGALYVMRDFGSGDPYIGISELVSGEIGDDISSYFANSEQTPSVCGLGVRANPDKSCKAAGGFLVQLLPGADEEIIPKLEANIEKMTSVSQLVAEGKSAEEIIGVVFDGIPFDLFESYPIGYVCTCSREKYKNALVGLNEKDLDELLAENKPIETACRFCGEKYVFSVEEIAEERKARKAASFAEKEEENK